MPTKKTKDVSDKDLTQLVKSLKSTGFVEYAQYLKSPWRIIWTNFLGGIFRGLGILVGMTIVVSLMIWMLTNLVDFPLIGKYFEELLEIIKALSLQNSSQNIF